MKQNRLTRKHGVFLLLYPLVHCALSYVFLMMAIAKGFLIDANDPQPTRAQEIASLIGTIMLHVLWAPINLAYYFGIRHLPGSDWLWIALTGIMYSWLFLIILEVIEVRRQKHHVS